MTFNVLTELYYAKQIRKWCVYYFQPYERQYHFNGSVLCTFKNLAYLGVFGD